MQSICTAKCLCTLSYFSSNLHLLHKRRSKSKRASSQLCAFFLGFAWKEEKEVEKKKTRWAEIVTISPFAESKNPRREHGNHEKPWQIHPKKPKKSKSDLAVSSLSPPSPESKSCKLFHYFFFSFEWSYFQAHPVTGTRPFEFKATQFGYPFLPFVAQLQAPLTFTSFMMRYNYI